MVGWLVNYQLKSMWKEAFVTKFVVTPWNVSGGAERNYEKP